MKKLVSLFLCLLLLAGCAETYDGPTRSAQVLGETVATYYLPTSGSVAYTERTVYAYDIYGNQCLEYQYYNDDLNYKTTKTCDAAGNVLKERLEWKPDWLWKEIVSIKTSYDNQNLPTSRTVHSDGDTQCYVWTYDSLGRPLTQDTNGSRKTYTYDDANHTQTEADENGTMVFQQFREDGALLLRERTSADGTVTRTEYTRREDGQPETIQTWKNGILTNSEEYTYDDQGRPIQHKVTGEHSSLTCWEYAAHQQTVHQHDGTYTVTDYNTDGSIRCETWYLPSGEIGCRTDYIYRSIQVPAEEVSQ